MRSIHCFRFDNFNSFDFLSLDWWDTLLNFWNNIWEVFSYLSDFFNAICNNCCLSLVCLSLVNKWLDYLWNVLSWYNCGLFSFFIINNCWYYLAILISNCWKNFISNLFSNYLSWDNVCHLFILFSDFIHDFLNLFVLFKSLSYNGCCVNCLNDLFLNSNLLCGFSDFNSLLSNNCHFFSLFINNSNDYFVLFWSFWRFYHDSSLHLILQSFSNCRNNFNILWNSFFLNNFAHNTLNWNWFFYNLDIVGNLSFKTWNRVHNIFSFYRLLNYFLSDSWSVINYSSLTFCIFSNNESLFTFDSLSCDFIACGDWSWGLNDFYNLLSCDVRDFLIFVDRLYDFSYWSACILFLWNYSFGLY